MTFDAITLVPKFEKDVMKVSATSISEVRRTDKTEKHFIPIDADGNNTKILKAIYYPEAFYVLPEKWD